MNPRSFHLDKSTATELADSWPAILLGLLITGLLLYLSWFNQAWRVLLIAFGAVYFGYVLRGNLTKRLRSQYPHAMYQWLLSIGLTSAALGVFARMLLPNLQGGVTDMVWVTISFSTILAFVLINRRDPDVLN